MYMKYKKSLQKCSRMVLVTLENVNFINNSVNCITGDRHGGGIYSVSLFSYNGNWCFHDNPQTQVILSNSTFETIMSKHLIQKLEKCLRNQVTISTQYIVNTFNITQPSNWHSRNEQ